MPISRKYSLIAKCGRQEGIQIYFMFNSAFIFYNEAISRQVLVMDQQKHKKNLIRPDTKIIHSSDSESDPNISSGATYGESSDGS